MHRDDDKVCITKTDMADGNGTIKWDRNGQTIPIWVVGFRGDAVSWHRSEAAAERRAKQIAKKYKVEIVNVGYRSAIESVAC